MRYYDILLTSPDGGGTRHWTSYPNGSPDPGALKVELDVYTTTFATPLASAYQAAVKIWGVGIQDIAQQNYFGMKTQYNAIASQGWSIAVQAGMGGGLPLENPSLSGTLFNGTVFQSYGNWVGTDMNLSLLVVPSGQQGFVPYPGNFSFAWRKGQPLSSAISSTLSTGAPSLKNSISISSNLTQGYDKPGFYGTLQDLARAIKDATNGLLGSSYSGVDMTMRSGTLYVFDGTQTAPKTVQIAFTDMIGQPVWVAPFTLQVQLVMRGDIQVGDTINLPPGLPSIPGFVQTTPQSQPFTRNQTAFSGNFTVTMLRHVGNSRDPNGLAWMTIVTCVGGASAA